MPPDPGQTVRRIFADLAKRGHEASAAAQAARPTDQPAGHLRAIYWGMSPAVDVEILNADELFADGSCPDCLVGLGKRTNKQIKVRYADPIGRRCHGVIAQRAEWPKGPRIQLFSAPFLDFLGNPNRRRFGWRPVEVVNRGKASQQLFELIRSRAHVAVVSLRGGNPDSVLACETCGRSDVPTYPLVGQLPNWLNPAGSHDRTDPPVLFVATPGLRAQVPAWFTAGDWTRGVYLIARERPWGERRPAAGRGIGVGPVGSVARHLTATSRKKRDRQRRRLTSAEAAGARRLRNESFFSAPQLNRIPLGSQRLLPYEPRAVEAYFDEYGESEWDRFDRFALGAVHEHIHNHFLERFVQPGSRVLDIGAGPGRFTQTLHRLGCRIVVADISEVQLELNRRYGAEKGFGASIEGHLKLDICDLSSLPAASFDVVVAYGGPLSYVFERRDEAAASCRRVLRPSGILLASVMSLWGTLHRHLAALRDLPLSSMVDIVATGDLTPDNDPTSRHKCHLFQSSELVQLLRRHGFSIEALAASNALSTNLEPLLLELRQQPDRWQALLELECKATAQPGYVDGGTHLLVAGRAVALAA